MWSISKKYGVTVDELKRENNLTTNSLSIGQLLKIPSSEESSSTGDTYTVKAGDTLYAIARKYEITVDELKKYNNLSNNNLSIGQVLKIPTDNTIQSGNYIEYTVKKGDNLYAIGRSYGVTQDEIMRFNNLSSNLLSIGQVLRIPINQNDTTGITYTVKSGDTLYSIASRYNTTVEDIKKKNNLTSNSLSIGQTLII